MLFFCFGCVFFAFGCPLYHFRLPFVIPLFSFARASSCLGDPHPGGDNSQIYFWLSDLFSLIPPLPTSLSAAECFLMIATGHLPPLTILRGNCRLLATDGRARVLTCSGFSLAFLFPHRPQRLFLSIQPAPPRIAGQLALNTTIHLCGFSKPPLFL